MKKCKKCGKEKEDWQFYTLINKETGREYLRGICRECKKKEKNQAYNQAWHREKEYGMTTVKFEMILKEQENKCLICGKKLIDPCIDHCHKTFKIRGLLCHKCNRGLGHFDDNPELLEKAAKYLRERN